MEETRRIQCSCGQENQLVLSGGKWRFDAARHGNGEPCSGLCFNCRAPLKDDELFPAESTEAPVPVDDGVGEPVDDVVDDTVDELEAEIAQMNRIQLFERAGELGIKVPFVITNDGIRKLIAEHKGSEKTEEQRPGDE